jgi:hypothetical protein
MQPIPNVAGLAVVIDLVPPIRPFAEKRVHIIAICVSQLVDVSSGSLRTLHLRLILSTMMVPPDWSTVPVEHVGSVYIPGRFPTPIHARCTLPDHKSRLYRTPLQRINRKNIARINFSHTVLSVPGSL